METGMSVPLLDEAFGGVLPGQAYFAHGVSGVGKTVLGLQVTHGWIGTGRRVLFLTADPPETLLEQASLLGLSLDRPWREERLVVAGYGPGVAAQVRTHGMRAFLEQLQAAGESHDVQAIVLDPSSALFDPYPRGSEIERDVHLLAATLRDWNWSALFLDDTEQLRQRPGLRESLGAQCAGVVELCSSHCRKNPAESPFLLRVERTRQFSASGRMIPYAIALEAGPVPVPMPPEDEEEELAQRERQRRRRALLAAPPAEELEPLIQLLRRTMDVERVSDGVAALSRAATWVPDVMLLDMELTKLSGFAIARALRQGNYRAPIILMTGHGRRRSDRVRALLNGATDLVQKPFDDREVAARIRMASRMHVAAMETGREQHLLDTLTTRARQLVLPVPEFLDGVQIALRAAARFSSPVSLVTFRRVARAAAPADSRPRLVPLPEPGSEAPWEQFRALLRREIRGGDLVTHPDPESAAVLLCHENEPGARAFAERVRGLAQRQMGAVLADQPDWEVLTGSLTVEVSPAEPLQPRDLLRAALEQGRPLFAAHEEARAGRRGEILEAALDEAASHDLPMTGTDGE